MKISPLLLFLALIIQPVLSQTPYKMVLFDYTQNETAGNSDWIIDTDMPVPSPAQSGITQSTAESYWLGGISAWGVDLVKKGYTVHTLTNTYGITYGNSGNPYDLSNYNLFIVCEPQNLFTAAEKQAILSYVQNGGGLIMVADHNNSDRDNDGYDSPEVWNDFGAETYFGIHFQSVGDSYNYFSDTTSNLSTSATDSIIKGAAGTVLKISYNGGTSMSLNTASNPSAEGHAWQTGAAQGTTRVMASTATYGLGRVGGVGDSSPADDGSAQPGNSSIYNGWTATGITNNLLFLNMSIWCASAPRTVTQPPVQVTLLSPSNSASEVSLLPTFRWYRTDSTTKYHLQVSPSNTFSTFIVNDSTLTDTLKSVSTLSANSTYYWRVRAGNTGGWGTYSSTWSFTSWSTPPQVTTVFPSNGSLSMSIPVAFRWNTALTATGYHLQVSISSSFTSFILNDSTLTDTTSSLSGLNLNTLYYWRVRAKNAAGWGSYSTTANFTTWNVPAQITTVAPLNSAANVSIPAELRWNAIQEILCYQLQVSTSGIFSTFITNDSTLTDTLFSQNGLDLNTTYFWRVRAKNNAGWGTFSSTTSFTTQDIPGQVLLSAPEDNGALPAPILLQWQPAVGAESYEIDLSTSSLFDSFVYRDSLLTDQELLVSSLDSGVTYYWRVRGKNSAGYGAYSETRSFHVIVLVTLQEDVVRGWNLVSVPLVLEDTRKTSIFPGSISSAFAFDGGYVVKDTLEHGVGYWLKFGSADSIILTGYPISSDTIVVRAGWNLIGSINVPLAKPCVVAIGTTIVSDFYTFASGYIPATDLLLMKGYWVKVSTDGLLVVQQCVK